MTRRRRGFRALFLVLLPALYLLGPYWQRVGTLACLYALAVLGLFVGVGLARQLNAGQAAFMAMGAYGSGYAALHGVSFPITVFLGAVVSLCLGLVAGAIALRASGLYLALATAGLGVALTTLIQNTTSLGAVDGLAGIPPVFSSSAWYGVAVLALAAGYVLARHIAQGRLGRRFRALQNEVFLQSTGLDPLRLKVQAFALSALYGGVAGGLFAHWNQVVSPDTFSFDLSILLLVALYVGGTSDPLGAVLGGVMTVVIAEVLRPMGGAWAGLAFGVLVVLVVLYAPGGLWGEQRQCFAPRG